MEGPARRLGISPQEVALGAVEVANAAMERALRHVSITDGHDPAGFSLVAFGGAGPLHACELADAIGARDVIVPASPGALSALGLAIAPRRALVSRSVRGLVGARTRREDARPVLDTLTRRARALAGEDATVETLAEARYQGQSWEIAVEWPDGVDLEEAFHAEHERRFGYKRPAATVEVVTLRAVATAPSQRSWPSRPGGHASETRRAPVLVARGSLVDALVIGRDGLTQGEVVVGPAIVTQIDATTWIAPGWRGALGASGELHLRPARD
jgi:N-methylhydantoinase A